MPLLWPHARRPPRYRQLPRARKRLQRRRVTAMLLLEVGAAVWAVATAFPALGTPPPEHRPTAGSAGLPIDRGADLLRAELDARLAKGDLRGAFAVANEMLASRQDRFVAADEHRIVRAWEYARQRLNGLSEPAHAAYEAAYGPAARRRLQTARDAFASGDATAATASTEVPLVYAPWLEVYRQFPTTRAALDALVALTLLAVDRGDAAMAAAAAAAVRAHRQFRPETLGWVDNAVAALLKPPPPPASGAATHRATGPTGKPAPPCGWPSAEIRGPSAPVAITRPLWRVPLLVRPPSPLLTGMLRRFDEHGIAVLPVARPLIVGRFLVMRTLDGVRCFDSRDGRLLWQTPPASEQAQEPPPVVLPEFRDRLAALLVRRWSADTMHGRAASDGRRIFVIEPPVRRPGAYEASLDAAMQMLRMADRDAPRTLLAIDLRSGRPLWRRRGVFASLPRWQLGRLWNLEFTDDGLALNVLDAATGEVRRTAAVLQVTDATAQTTARLTTDGDIRQAGRLLLCATAAGAVVGFDPLLHRVAFVTRFPRLSPEQPLNSMRAADNIVDWWARFREARIEVQDDGTAIAVLPDAARLACLDSRDGRVIWSLPRRDAIALVAVAADRVLLQHPSGLRAIDRRSGEELWTAMTGAVAGDAALVPLSPPPRERPSAQPSAAARRSAPPAALQRSNGAAVVLVPLSAGGWARVDVSSGRVTFPVPSWTEPLGNLLATSDALFSTDGKTVARHLRLPAANGWARREEAAVSPDAPADERTPTTVDRPSPAADAPKPAAASPNEGAVTGTAPETIDDAKTKHRLVAALLLREFGRYDAAVDVLDRAAMRRADVSSPNRPAEHDQTRVAGVERQQADDGEAVDAAQALAPLVLHDDLDGAPDVLRRLRWQTLAIAVARSERLEAHRRFLPRLFALAETAEERLAARLLECRSLFRAATELARSARTTPSAGLAKAAAADEAEAVRRAIEHAVEVAFGLLETAPDTPIDTGDLGLSWVVPVRPTSGPDSDATVDVAGWDLSAYGLLGSPVVGQRRTAHASRLIAGIVWDGLRTLERLAPDVTRQTVRAYFAGVLQRDDPFAVQRVARRTEWWPEGAALRLDHRRAAEIGESAIAAELALWRLVERSSGAARHRAYHALFAFYVDQRHEYDALAVLRRWQHEFPAAVVLANSPQRDGRTETGAASTAPADAVAPIRPEIPRNGPLARLLAGHTAPWPAGGSPIRTTIDEKTRIDRDVYYVPVPVRTTHGALDRLSVSLDRTGRVLRFDSDLVDGPWKLRLPTGRSPFRQAYTTYRGWAVGRLLLVQLGTELFAVQPFDDAGEPRARVLWSNDVLSAFDVVAMLQSDGPPGQRDQPVRLVDAMGDGVADVADVRADRIALFDGGRLRVIDPLSGRQVWQRGRFPLQTHVVPLQSDLLVILPPGLPAPSPLPDALAGHRHMPQARPAAQDAAGRSHRVAPTERLALVLRGIDGAIAAWSVIQTPPGEVWIAEGWEWVVGKRAADDADGRGWLVRRIDIRDGSEIWQRRLNGTAAFVFPDDRRVGAVGGTAIELLDAGTGESLARHTIPRTDARSAIVTRDADRLYVLAVESPASTRVAAVDQIRSGWRNPLATGRLCALRRSDARLLWTTAWRDAAFPLDPPRHAPVLVSAFQIPGPNGGRNLHGSVIRVHDGRTGTRLAELQGSQGDVYWSIEAHPRDRWFDLLTRRRIERFRFPPPEADTTPGRNHRGEKAATN